MGLMCTVIESSFCKDIDECQLNNGGCSHLCNNMEGSFQCACLTGFELDVNSDKNCTDINECLAGKENRCIPDVQRCLNVPGSFRCEGKSVLLSSQIFSSI